MLILDESSLLRLQSAIVEATHSLVDQDGQRVTLGTIDDRRLSSAALAAMLITVGQVVWPANEPIHRPRPKQSPGPFVE